MRIVVTQSTGSSDAVPPSQSAQQSETDSFLPPSSAEPLDLTAVALVDAALASARREGGGAVSGTELSVVHDTQELRVSPDEAAANASTAVFSIQRPFTPSLSPSSAAVAAATLPVDPLFPSAPSTQLLQAVTAAEEEVRRSASAPTGDSASPDSLASAAEDSFLSTPASLCFPDPSSSPTVGQRTAEVIVQERLRWMSAHTLSRRSNCMEKCRCPSVMISRCYFPCAVSLRRQEGRAQRAERVERRKAELLLELEQLLTQSLSATPAQLSASASAVAQGKAVGRRGGRATDGTSATTASHRIAAVR